MSTESPPAPAKRARTKPRPPLAPAALDATLILAFLALTFLLGVFPLKDTDFWWHLRTGDLIRQTGQVPRHDLYTFTVPDHPWVDLHWGFQVALSWGYQRGGVVALNLAKCAITCAAVLLLVTARRRDWPIWVMVLAWLPALLVLGGRMYVRPETLTLLFLAIDLAILTRWDRRPALAFLLPLVQLAWVNTHGLFVLGPVLIGFTLVDALLRPGSLAAGRKRWWRIVAASTALTGLVCLVNPYGITGALYPLQLARTMANPVFANAIAELTPIPLFIKRSAGWRNLPLQLQIATMILGALSFLLPMFWTVSLRFRGPAAADADADAGADAGKGKGRGAGGKAGKGASKRSKKGSRGAPGPEEPAWRLSPLRLLLFVAFSALSWRATRNSHQFAAVVGALTAWNFAEWAAAIRARRTSRDPATGTSGLAPRLATLAVVVGVFATVASGQFYAWAGEGRTIGLGEEPLWFPHEAMKFAGRGDMPRRFLSFHDGYAALYEYHNGPDRKVYADARLEVMGVDLYQRYVELGKQIGDGDPAWIREVDEAGRPAILAGHEHSAVLGSAIMGNPAWRCVWFDPMVAIYVHRSYSDAIKAHGVDLAARHFAPEPATDPKGTPALKAEAEALWKYANGLQSHGRVDLARPLVLLGLDYARRIRQADPESLDAWKLLGKLEAIREPMAPPPTTGPPRRYLMPFDPVFDLSMARATHDLRRALEIAPRDFLTLMLLSNLYQSRGMDEEAGSLLGRLGRVAPINPEQAGFVEGAAAQRAQLLGRLGPPAPATWENLSQLDRAVGSLLAHGRARSAAEFLERAYPDEPRPWEVTDRLATLYLHLGEPGRARALWEKAAPPPRPAVRSARLAATHLVEGDFAEARRGYLEALNADPDLFEALYGLAVLEQDAGRAPASLAAARRALAAAPGDVARTASQDILTLVRPYGSAEDTPTPRVQGPSRIDVDRGDSSRR